MADDTNDINRIASSDRSTVRSAESGVSRRAVLGSVTGLAATGVGSTAVSATLSSSVSSPTVEGPIDGGSQTGGPLLAAPHDLDSYGYVEEEYFISGEARHDDSFADGEQAGKTSEYKTRVLVYRPKRRSDFNGTVTVEWLNVSTQMDAPVAWPNAYDSLMRNGTAVALVSAQKVGVDDSQTDRDLVSWDPERYGSLHHPGDQYALDIFAQAITALKPRGWDRWSTETDPMGPLRPEHALATGHSQSAFFLLRYINLAAPAYGVVDGFLPAGSPLTTARTDQAPILWFNSEDEAGGFGDIPQDGDTPEIDIPTSGLRLDEISIGPRDDEAYFVLWEVAGASHVNNWLRRWTEAVRRRDFRGLEPNWDPEAAGDYGQQPDGTYGECGYNYFPARYAWRAALEQLREWVTRGDRPPRADRIERTIEDGSVTLERDYFGNAEGGLRLPPLDVPVATYDAASCDLTGRTDRFDAATLDRLYPSHDAYVTAIRSASVAAVTRGHLLPRDARDLRQRAADSPIGE
ncbi:alpha/beta hydrolase domain-containing protein [Natrinema marinum]|uniref:alpha/beta hydrolase domain-containing protein n=1 Tax=Natrinema marinum TaxID=2961598 RepID=UPI0020C8CE41|nr:alpha/beta hydrolase domain-containing protein [Natrinema marinum]